MKRVSWSRRAARDLVEIGEFIAADDPMAARRWVERLRDRTRLAAVTPRAGRLVPELARDDVREVFLRTYRIVYRILPRQIAVITVFEGHRQLPMDLDLCASSEPDPRVDVHASVRRRQMKGSTAATISRPSGPLKPS